MEFVCHFLLAKHDIAYIRYSYIYILLLLFQISQHGQHD